MSIIAERSTAPGAEHQALVTNRPARSQERGVCGLSAGHWISVGPRPGHRVPRRSRSSAARAAQVWCHRQCGRPARWVNGLPSQSSREAGDLDGGRTWHRRRIYAEGAGAAQHLLLSPGTAEEATAGFDAVGEVQGERPKALLDQPLGGLERRVVRDLDQGDGEPRRLDGRQRRHPGDADFRRARPAQRHTSRPDCRHR